MLQNLLVDGWIDFGLDKTQWTNSSRRHGTPNHHWLQKLNTGLQAAWILCLSSLPPDSRTWFPNEKQQFTFIWKEDFGPLSNSPVLFLLSSGKMLLTIFLFQKWIGSPFPEDVWAWWLLNWCSFSSLLVIPRIYTVWRVIYWNSNVNILIFKLSLVVSSNHQN